MRSSTRSDRLTPLAVLVVTLFVFAAVVAYVSLWLRSGLREQILYREAEALTEIAALQVTNEAATLADAGVTEVPAMLLPAVLKTSRLRGVFAVRVFDSSRQFAAAVPLTWSETPPEDAEWSTLQTGKPIARLHPRRSPAEVLGVGTTENGVKSEPLLETWLPLRLVNGRFVGAAQMWTDGSTVAREFAALDRRVWKQAVFAWAAGSAIIGVLLVWSFRRLGLANRELRARTEDLLRANRQLTLAAKTSALGAVTAHLMHELKNPVAGLEEFVASQEALAPGGERGGELAAASELTRRLRAMINDVISVMRDEQSGAFYELTIAEMSQLALAKARPLASARDVTVDAGIDDNGTVSGRVANLGLLILQNLLQNAIEACASGGAVRLRARSLGAAVIFEVEDDGPGLPAAVRERLFHPCPSSKRGGTGLGLALSQQLARQVGGRIELVRSDAEGTCFQLVLQREA